MIFCYKTPRMRSNKKNGIDYGVPLLTFIITLLLFHSIEATLRDLVKTTVRSFRNLSGFNRYLAKTEAGEELLTPKVQEMLSLIKDYHLSTYKISKGIMDDHESYMQIVAAAWPKKFESSSADHFYLISENLPTHCDKLVQKKEVVFVHCH